MSTAGSKSYWIAPREDGEEVCEGEVEDDAVEVEGVCAVVMPVEHVPVLHPVVSEYHVLRDEIKIKYCVQQEGM